MTIITSAISIRISRLLCSFCLRAFSRAAALRALPDLEEDLPEPVFFLVVPDEFRALVPLLPFLLFELVDADPLFLAEVPFLVVCVIYFLCVLPYCSFVNPTYTYQSAGYGTHYSGSNIKIIVIRNLNIKMILSVRHLPFICQIKFHTYMGTPLRDRQGVFQKAACFGFGSIRFPVDRIKYIVIFQHRAASFPEPDIYKIHISKYRHSSFAHRKTAKLLCKNLHSTEYAAAGTCCIYIPLLYRSGRLT